MNYCKDDRFRGPCAPTTVLSLFFFKLFVFHYLDHLIYNFLFTFLSSYTILFLWTLSYRGRILWNEFRLSPQIFTSEIFVSFNVLTEFSVNLTPGCFSIVSPFSSSSASLDAQITCGSLMVFSSTFYGVFCHIDPISASTLIAACVDFSLTFVFFFLAGIDFR